MTVSIPDAGDGSRRRSRRRKRWRGLRTPSTRAVGVVVVVALVAAIVWAVVNLAVGDDAGSRGDALSGSASPSSATAPSLVVLTGDDGAVYGVTILVPSASTIVYVPPGTMVEVPSLGLVSLHDAARDGGIGLLEHALENELGVRFAAEATLAPADLASVVASVPKLTVSIDAPVEDRTAAGRVTIVVPSGTQTLRPAAALAFLSKVGDRTSLELLVRHQAFWTAYLGALGVGAPAAALAPVTKAVRGLAGRDLQHKVLPVVAVSGTAGNEELYRVVDADLSALVARLFEVKLKRITVQVLNGVGQPGIAQKVQPLLVEAGGRVTLSANADRFDYATTQVVYYDDSRLDDAKAIRDALGVGELVKSLTGLDVVDVTVVVGADFLTAHPGG